MSVRLYELEQIALPPFEVGSVTLNLTFNPFVPNAPCLCPLKTSKNLTVF